MQPARSLIERLIRQGGGWSEATLAVAGLEGSGMGYGTCGLLDGSEPGEWKLPTRAEWEAFMSKVYREPALVNTVGDGRWSEGDAFYYVMSADFWSRTAIDADTACYADMGNGETYEDWTKVSMYIWPVRKEHRFKDMGDGTIRDNVSGLIWLKDASCGDLPHTDEYGRANWENANVGAAELAWGTCGLRDGSDSGDWRLPTGAEWIEFSRGNYVDPSLVSTRGDAQWEEGDAFIGVVTSVNYWTSESVEWDQPQSFDMSNGMVWFGSHTEKDGVWPVRSGN